MNFVQVEFSQLRTLNEGDGTFVMVDSPVMSESLLLDVQAVVSQIAQPYATARATVKITNASDRWIWVVMGPTPTVSDVRGRRLLGPTSELNLASSLGDKVGVAFVSA